MNDELVKNSQELWKKYNNFIGSNQLSQSMPFLKDVSLLKCMVAGTTYNDLTEVLKEIKKGDILTLRREIDNKYDEFAIAIYDSKDRKVGYIPQKKNKVFSRMLDAGKHLYVKYLGRKRCISFEKYYKKEYVKIFIEVFMSSI